MANPNDHHPHDHSAHGHHPRHHGHGHGHHGHHHPPASHGMAFAVAITLNAAFVLIEAAAGIWSGSTALLADAGHNLSDVLALLLAWGASVLAARRASSRYTYGFKTSSILATIANAALLWIALGAVLVETVRRFLQPEPVESLTIIWVAAAGIAVNFLSALLFASGSKGDLNIRAAFLHLMADAAVSAGVVVAGVAIWFTGALWIDPAASLIITLALGWASWDLMREAVRMGLLGVPRHIDHAAVQAFLEAQQGISAVHDLHIWPMSTTETALTAHLVMKDGWPDEGFLPALGQVLENRFRIEHSTIQIERGDACSLAEAHRH